MPTTQRLFEKARIQVAGGTDRVQRALDRTADACLGAIDSAEAVLRRLARLIKARGPVPLDSPAVPLDNIATLVGGYPLPIRERVTHFWRAPAPAAKP